MYNSWIFKVLICLGISLGAMAFKDKYKDKNLATGVKKADKADKVKTEATTTDLVEESEEELVLNTFETSEDKRRFDSWYLELENKVKSAQAPKKRLEVLHKELEILEAKKETLLNLNFMEEIEIDFLTKPLRTLPKVASFSSSSCPEYRNNLLVQFDPSADEQNSKDPTLKRAIDVFNLICK